jgi:RNA-directed DNA polymerase
VTAWEFPTITSADDLADRLELDRGQLLWLSDLRGIERSARTERLRNYRYRLIPRRAGGLPRVLEIPKGRTKEIQRWILAEILDQLPVHDAAHGFRRGRSAVTHAERHCEAPMVLTLDLADFFTTVRRPRVARTFVALGYRAEVARLLAGLCTNVIPVDVWAAVEAQAWETESEDGRRFRLGRMLASPHLPQGAPTSPALANLAVNGLDRRLTGLARAFELRYSRYADDLTFSGPSLAPARRRQFVELVSETARREGFGANQGKTHTHLAGGRQTVCGVVVNVHPNVARGEYDRLRATVHNCVVHGPAGQNRAGVPDFRAHLRGRIAWVTGVNPARGARLLAEFEAIEWSS